MTKWRIIVIVLMVLYRQSTSQNCHSERSVSHCQFVYPELHVLILILIMRIVKRKIQKSRIKICEGGIDVTFAENINRICAERGTNLTADVKAVKVLSSSHHNESEYNYDHIRLLIDDKNNTPHA